MPTRAWRSIPGRGPNVHFNRENPPHLDGSETFPLKEPCSPRPSTTSSAGETVAVVIVTYNSSKLLPDLVRSLSAGLGNLKWHLTVVDNASADDSVAQARRLAPQALIVETGRNAGYAAGINAGVLAAPPHSCILVLNPDVRLLPDCVPALISL